MLLLDAHVHFHNCFDITRFCNSICDNFQEFATANKWTSFQCGICFTESSGVSFFSRLKDTDLPNGLSVELCKDNNSLILRNDKGFEIYCFAGRQIVTKENLEVLALGMVQDYPDGLPIREVIQAVIDEDCIPVLPWGFGKWTGQRKKVIETILDQNDFAPLFLGDNGNRPSMTRLPSLLEKGYGMDMLNLQGSDPLPFRREENKAGSFGVILDVNLNRDRPFETLCKALSKKRNSITTYGKLESPIRFMLNQVAMQIVKRLR